ncbi:membrane protein [Stylonychia lemnae]|uniref:Membrane protein n=1 Tax=Stylonychia lemnae TaxID=5949 RepID=A0A078AD14_STYLE|nr:membrane protein [Stylonychia lemnae]|eukprot:CDW78748.1 membrane protein [Stylonychia lemnae]
MGKQDHFPLKADDSEVSSIQSQEQNIFLKIFYNLRGLILYSLGIFTYSFGNLLFMYIVKNYQVSSFEILFWASFIMLFSFFIHSQIAGQDLLDIKVGFKKFLICRILFGTMNDGLLYLSYNYLTYSKATTIQFGGSFIVPFLSYYFLGDKIQKEHLIFIFLGFLGILFMVQPFKDESNTQSKSSSEIELLGSFIALGAALTGAFILIFIRKLQNSGLHFTVVPVYYALGNIIMQPILGYFLFNQDQNNTKIAGHDWILILSFIGIGFNLYISNIFFTLAFNYANPSAISIVQYVAMPITFLQDLLIFGNVPKSMEIIGAALILLSNLAIAFHEYKSKKE